MRQTLFRIRLDDLWSLEPIGNISAAGVGYVILLPSLVLGLWWGMYIVRKTGLKAEHWLPIGIWFAIAAVALMIPQWSRNWKSTSIPVYGYGFMLLVGFLLAGWMASRRAQHEGLAAEVIWDLATWLFFSGIVGARLFYLIQFRKRVFADKQRLDEYVLTAVNLPDGGLVLYGGVLFGIVAYLIFCHRQKISPLLMADVAIPSFFIALACGRFGCFLNGCCYGDPCELPWAITFPQGSVPFIGLVNRGFSDPDAVTSMPLHPTQLYSSINAMVLGFLTASYFKHRNYDGAVITLALISYPITRFVIEILRSDGIGQWGTGLTISQLVSLAVLVFGIGLGYWCWLKQPLRNSSVTTGLAQSPV